MGCRPIVGVVVWIVVGVVGVVPHAAAFSDNESAANLLGQYDDTLSNPQPVYTKATVNDGPNRLGISAPEGMLADEVNHRLFVSDAGNNRVLVYDLESDNTLTNYIPDYVLGQSDFYTNTAATTQTSLNAPQGMAFDSATNRLFVAQSGANRVTVFDVGTVSNGESAINVLGQSLYTTTTAANSQTGMKTPQRLAYDAGNGYLFLTQFGNNRVTVYDVNAISDNEGAVNVLGQSTFTAFSAATTQAGMNGPVGVTYDPSGKRLFVSQSTSNRVTVYDLTAISDGESAINVLGQSVFTSATAANTQAGLNSPQGVAYDSGGGRLFVSQSGNHRVSVFNVTSISDGEGAVNVLGQVNFTSIASATSQRGLSSPQGVTYISSADRLYVTQSGNNRVSIFDVAAIGDGEDAVNLLGQYDDSLSDPQPVFSSIAGANNGPNRLGMSGPVGVALDGTNHRLFIADSANNRILVYDLAANGALSDRIPDYVLGQPDFHSNTAATTQNTLNAPQYLEYDATYDRLFVAQGTTNRVLVYDTASITNGEDAVSLLGQATYTTSTAANTQAGMKTPAGVAYDAAGRRLFVAQQGSHRVTVYDEATIDGKNAQDQVGQYDDQYLDPQPLYAGSSVNNSPNSLGFSAPRSLAVDETHHRLFLADTTNNRILTYNLDTDNTPLDYYPDYVLGQRNFYTNTAVNTQASVNAPQGIAYDSSGDRLFVAQSGANRVTVFDVASITSGENAVHVLGQTSYTTVTAANTQAGMKTPMGVVYDGSGSRLFVSQTGNNRVTVYDVAAISNTEDAVNVLGQSTFTAFAAATTQAGLNIPLGMAYDSANTRLFVAQSTGNRVTVFNVASISDGENAVSVLGQSVFTTATAATSQAGMNVPQGVAYDSSGQRLFVSQSTANRVTVYDVATITDGENATGVLGQSLFTTATAANTQAGLNTPQEVAYSPSLQYLYVAQSTNNRVSIFDVATVSDGEAAASLLGHYDDSVSDPQPVFNGDSQADNGPNRTGLNAPMGMAVDSVNHRLFVSDSGNNRILVFNLDTDDSLLDHIPDNVLGQSNFYSNAAANTQGGLNAPQFIAYDSAHTRLFVPQSTANRVTVFDVAAISDGENAASVLGQSTFTAITAANTQAGMKTPMGVAYDSSGNRLFVSQSGNHRVTVYDVAAITDGENATGVLGQSTFTAFGSAVTQAGMSTPQDVTYASGLLFVAQSTGNRVTVYDVSTVTDGENATNVLGQSLFTTATAAVTQAGMSTPQSVAVDSADNLLFVSQSTGNRVTVYNIAAISDGESAVNVLGQALFTTSTAANTQSGMNTPRGLSYDATGGRLYVAQSGANRIGVYALDTATFSEGQPASNVLGQSDFTGASFAVTQTGMATPTALAYDAAGTRLFVTENTGNRVMVYNVASITNGENAVNVLGQSLFTTSTAAVTQAGMTAPTGIAYDPTSSILYVASTINRVTSYDVTSISDGESAVNVLGQALFTTNTAANTQAGLNGVRGLSYDQDAGVLYVCQNTNSRVSIFGTPPSTATDDNDFFFLGE